MLNISQHSPAKPGLIFLPLLMPPLMRRTTFGHSLGARASALLLRWASSCMQKHQAAAAAAGAAAAAMKGQGWAYT
jgi:hypothetical protein